MFKDVILYIKNTSNYDNNFYKLIRVLSLRSLILQIYTVLSFEILSKNIFSYMWSFLFVFGGALGLIYMNKEMYDIIADTKTTYLKTQSDVLNKRLSMAKLNVLKNRLF